VDDRHWYEIDGEPRAFDCPQDDVIRAGRIPRMIAHEVSAMLDTDEAALAVCFFCAQWVWR